MRQTPSPDDVTRRQPHPTSGVMAASSQYHRGAAASANSHYRPLPGGHEHMYTNLATAWNGSHGFPRVGAPSAYLQRYLDYAGPSDYVNHHPSAQHAWPASQLATAPHEWTNPINNDASYTVRQPPYVKDEARPTVPHASPRARQQHHASSITHNVPLDAPGPVYRPVEHQNELHTVRTSNEVVECSLTFHQDQVAAPVAPSFPPQAPSSASVARLLNYPNPHLHVSTRHEQAQAPDSWPAVPNSNVPPAYPSQHPPHDSSIISSDEGITGQGPLPGSAWGMLDSEPNNPVCPVYEQVQHTEPDWQLVNALHLEQHGPTSGPPPVVVARRERHRAAPKKTLAKVTAAFNPRQRKLKVSKRNGPLSEASRIKTHKMRKERATCLRCRFYKAGVC
jgi:hypothetical protein